MPHLEAERDGREAERDDCALQSLRVFVVAVFHVQSEITMDLMQRERVDSLEVRRTETTRRREELPILPRP